MGHFYDENGLPKHTIPTSSPKAKKKFRDTNITDAKKMRLFPSFSGIADQLDKPNLHKWRTGIEIDSIVALFCAKGVDLTDKLVVEQLKSEAAKNASEEANSYSALGTEIHNALEESLKGSRIPEKFEGHIAAFWKALCDHLQCTRDEIEVILVEAPFAAKRFGYGGTIDLIIRLHGKYILVDLKTKKTKSGKECFISETNLMQLPAYKKGFSLQGHVHCRDPKMEVGWTPPLDSRMMLVIVSTTEEGRGEVREISKEEDQKYWLLFKNLINIWILRNDHDPRIFN